jgi:hypothetical protein
MKVYVCWGEWVNGPRKHPCGLAVEALREAGYEPEVVKTYGFGPLPEFLTPHRKPVRELTGQNWVPALELDDGSGIAGSKEIIAWAKAHPASEAAVADAAGA